MAKIEKLTLNDLDDIMKMEPTLFSQPFSRKDYYNLLDNHPLCFGLKVVQDEKMIGYGVIQVVFEDANLLTIGIAETHQKQGFGKKLLEHLIDLADKKGALRMILEVRISNVSARKLYKSFGFRQNRIRKDYYQDEDGLELVLDWSEPYDNRNYISD